MTVEQKAEEYIKEHSFFDEEGGVLSLDVGSKTIFEDGAEFGYNKVNEWHYVKDGLPKENGRYLCQIECAVGGARTYECTDYDTEYNSWKDSYGDVIKWKEIE